MLPCCPRITAPSSTFVFFIKQLTKPEPSCIIFITLLCHIAYRAYPHDNMVTMQTRNVAIPQMKSSFLGGVQLPASPTRSSRVAAQRSAVTTQAIFGNKAKQPSLTKVMISVHSSCGSLFQRLFVLATSHAGSCRVLLLSLLLSFARPHSVASQPVSHSILPLQTRLTLA